MDHLRFQSAFKFVAISRFGDGGQLMPRSSKQSYNRAYNMKGRWSRSTSFSRDWQTNNCSSNVLNLITNGYVLPFLSKPNLVSFSLIISEYKALPKDQALAHCIQSLLSKNVIKRVENVKSLGVLQSPVSSIQASPEVEASYKLKQAQHFSTCKKF